jgi:hypothetical protein
MFQILHKIKIFGIINTMADEVKSVQLTGMAAHAITGGKPRRRAATRKKQEGGDMLRGVSANAMDVKGVENPGITRAGSTEPSSWLSYSSTTKLSPPMIQPLMNRAPTPPELSAAPTSQYRALGGEAKDTKSIKVELKKSTSAKKVKLQPKKTEAKPVAKKNQTKKSRKITLGVASLHKRMTRAKKVQHKVKAMPIDKLKKLLIEKKLIKPTSKAPESILRQIAADSQIMDGKSL